MAAWSSVRSWLRPGDARRGDTADRVRVAPTFRPMLEELETREAPGSLLGAAGQGPLSLLGSAPASTSRPAPTAAVPPGTQIVPAVSVPASQTSAQVVPATAAPAKSAATGLVADQLAPDAADAFDDMSSSPDAAAPPVQAVALPAVTPTSSAVPVAPPTDGGPTAAPQSSAAASAAAPANISIPVVPPPAPTVTLTAPAFLNNQGGQVVVNATANGVTALNPQVSIDVDLKHDGSFTDPGDENYAVGTLSNGSATIDLPALPAYGVYTIRARVTDSLGDVGVSANTTVVADPNAGVVGSEALLDLANGLPYGTEVPADGGGQNITHGNATAKDFSFLEFDSQGRVLVNVHSTLTQYLAGLQSDLENQFGFTTTLATPAQNMVTGWLPVNQILNLPNLANYDSVTPVYKPEANVGSYPTDADPVIHSDTFRTTEGVDGTGVKVGVISTSVNQVDGGLAQSEATGDVAPNVQVLEDDLAGGGSDEGRAMLEIVHHIAPGASEAFHSGFNGAQDMANGIQELVGVGARAITDDITYFDEPMFNDGVIAQAAESAVAQNVLYTTSAGNNSNHGYLAAWDPTNTTVGGVTGPFQQITPGNPLQTFTLGVGDTVTLSYQWDAAFLEGGSPGNGTGNFKVNNDMQVLVTDATGATLEAQFDATATTTNEAFAFVQFTNNGTFGTNNFAFSFEQVSGAAPTMIRWVSEDDGNTADDPHALLEGAPTSYGHEVAPGVVTTGAVDYTTPTVPEPFTAQGGPVPILFDVNGVRLATPETRVEPMVAAPDGVQTSVPGFFPFFGTSAATPHVAAAAALLMQQAPTATAAQVAQHLEQTALDINTPGFDNLTGYGLIQLTALTATGTGETEPETNQTSDTATNFGALSLGSTGSASESIGLLPDGRNDYDWFRWEAVQAGTFRATETTTTATTGNLEMHLFTLEGDTLVELVRGVTSGTGSETLSTSLAAGQAIFVEIKGEDDVFGQMGGGLYNLSVTLA